jgi:ribosomal protein L40E
MPQCCFCDHTNPATAKFCNECGSPLHLKPCRQCEAINDIGAKTCYKCGAVDPALAIAPEPDVAEPAGETAVDTTLAGPSHAQRRTHVRAAVAVAVLLFGALAVSAYYAYLNSVELKEWLSATWATVSPGGGDTPTTSVRETGSALASSAPAGSVGAASGAAAAPEMRSPATELATVATISPVPQDSVPATAAAAVDVQAPTPDQTLAPVASQPQVSTAEQAISTPRTPRVDKKSTNGKATAKKAKKTATKKPASAQSKPSSKASTAPVDAPTTPGTRTQ